MLIEVRSSPDDSNNTPNQLFQRFNETLILKPRSKIALVSALITTSAAGGFRIDGTNQTITLTVGNAPQLSFDVPIGDYTLAALTTALQVALRGALLASGGIYKDLFYPDTSITVAKSAADVVSITFKFDPQGFTSGTPNLTGANKQVTATNLDLNSVDTGVIMRSREEINNVNVETISKEVASGFDAINSILPYAKGATTANHNGVFQATTMLGVTPRQQHWGLNQATQAATGEWLLPSANPYTVDEVGGRVWRFDNYTPVNGVNHGYDWVAYGTGFTDPYYLKATSALDFGVNTTHKVIDPTLYDDTWSVREEADGNLGRAMYLQNSAKFIIPPGDQLINRRGENSYDIEVNTNSRVQVRYNGRLLNNPATTLLADGSGLRWVVNALDNSTITTKHPVPEIYDTSVAAPAWVEIPLNPGEVLPDVNTDDVLIPSYHADGKVCAGTIGNGDVTDVNTTPSFLASDMTISAQVGTFLAGEVLYQIGATNPAGGVHMKLLAVCGAALIGEATAALTAVLVMGNGYEGRNYAQNMTIPVKGLKSGSTATITLTAVTAPCATITAGGTLYTQGNEYDFVLDTDPASGSPTQPPIPFAQNGRHTNVGKVEVTATTAGGVISEVKFINGGSGYCIGDVITILSNGGGDGNGDGTLRVEQVCEDVSQVVMTTGGMDTYNVNGAFPPFTPQDTIALNTGEFGRTLDFDPVEYDGSVGAGINQPIISGAAAATPTVPTNENILIDLPGIPIGSRNSGQQGGQTGGNTDNHIATIPYQTDLTSPTEFHKQHYEPFNMIYHSMDNEADLNLNSFSVRLTNYDGTLRTDITHPTQLTFSIQPDYM